MKYRLYIKLKTIFFFHLAFDKKVKSVLVVIKFSFILSKNKLWNEAKIKTSKYRPETIQLQLTEIIIVLHGNFNCAIQEVGSTNPAVNSVLIELLEVVENWLEGGL